MQAGEIRLGRFLVGKGRPPFIIAEMSGNHNHSLDAALELVEVAAKAGAHAVKLQTYTADTMTLNLSRDEFFISDKNSPWKGETLYNLYDKAHTPWEWHKPIMEKAAVLGLECFSSPFDESSVEFLESLNVTCYKIASFENIDIPLIEKVASTGKPLIISTGMASEIELNEAVSAARRAGCKDLVLLKCTSTYPASSDDTNILTIPNMEERFGCLVGLSDHTMGIGVSVASVALGATMIEKHFTLNRSDGGVDASFSMEPAELQALVLETKRAWESLGQVTYGATAAEKESLKYRRSVYVVKPVKAGETLTSDNVRNIRPGLGLPPKFIGQILGKKVNRDVDVGTPMSWDLIDN